MPPLHLSCGDDDPTAVDYTTGFAEAALAAGHDVTLDLRPGTHEWSFWDAEIQRVLAWLPLVRGDRVSGAGKRGRKRDATRITPRIPPRLPGPDPAAVPAAPGLRG